MTFCLHLLSSGDDAGCVLLFQVEQPRLLGVDSDEDASQLTPARSSDVSTDTSHWSLLAGQSLSLLCTRLAFLSISQHRDMLRAEKQ